MILGSQNLLRPVRVSADIESGCQRLDAVQPPRLAVVDRVGGDEVGQQPLALAAHLVPLHLLRAGPGALYDGRAVLVEEFLVGRRDDVLAVGGDDDAVVALAEVQVAHHAQPHELLPGAPLGVAVAEVPAGGLERRTGGGSFVTVLVAGLARGAAAMEFTLALAMEVFLVSNHGGVYLVCIEMGAWNLYAIWSCRESRKAGSFDICSNFGLFLYQ
ncbi:unnamed protein product [Clonostachys chloroleuca]|uniref:Uncharacterized protein n=1 Tax=Clonostachys chloroleuca TaxID=1926264 RepID=A0AA35Q7K1_9HYPO|nr:unnamed protein product [Clonostachys chloroleuca]